MIVKQRKRDGLDVRFFFISGYIVFRQVLRIPKFTIACKLCEADRRRRRTGSERRRTGSKTEDGVKDGGRGHGGRGQRTGSDVRIFAFLTIPCFDTLIRIPSLSVRFKSDLSTAGKLRIPRILPFTVSMASGSLEFDRSAALFVPAGRLFENPTWKLDRKFF